MKWPKRNQIQNTYRLKITDSCKGSSLKHLWCLMVCGRYRAIRRADLHYRGIVKWNSYLNEFSYTTHLCISAQPPSLSKGMHESFICARCVLMWKPTNAPRPCLRQLRLLSLSYLLMLRCLGVEDGVTCSIRKSKGTLSLTFGDIPEFVHHSTKFLLLWHSPVVVVYSNYVFSERVWCAI